LLTRRANNISTGEKLIELIRWWEDYAARHGSEINNNPTPGNKAGGLTTILEKSLGAVAKAGSTNLNGVYRYAEPIETHGLSFMDSPGYDPCSITGEVASGANLICFTTGRGSVYGNQPVPSIKLATNTALYDHMNDDMDINCGTVLEGDEDLDQLGNRIFKKILEIASGDQTLSERNGFGECEFVPWQTGAQM
jgi:altronate hydrolase